MKVRMSKGKVILVAFAVLGVAGCGTPEVDVQTTDNQVTQEQGRGQDAFGLTGTDYCYGAHGPNCNGIPPNLNPSQVSGNIWNLPVSVGAQIHDKCCNNQAALGVVGYMCNLNTNTSVCQSEWNQAASDQAYGYVWWRQMDVSIGTPWSASTPIAGLKAPAGTKLAVNYAKQGWCASGSWYTINFGLQAVCR